MDAKLKQQLEQIPQDVLDEFIESLQRHTYSARLDAHHSVSVRSIRGGSCSKTDLVVLSGNDTTGSGGTKKILIDSLLCGVVYEGLAGGSLVMVREPNCVATAQSSAPVFVTVQTTSKPGPSLDQFLVTDRDGNPIDSGDAISGVEVNIASWKHDGNIAPGTTFAWICTIEAARAYPIG